MINDSIVILGDEKNLLALASGTVVSFKPTRKLNVTNRSLCNLNNTYCTFHGS